MVRHTLLLRLRHLSGDTHRGQVGRREPRQSQEPCITRSGDDRRHSREDHQMRQHQRRYGTRGKTEEKVRN